MSSPSVDKIRISPTPGELLSGRRLSTSSESRSPRTCHACVACKKRKRKCSGPPSQCRACKKSGTHCVFNEKLDMRRKNAYTPVVVNEEQQYILDSLLRCLKYNDIQEIQRLVDLIRRDAAPETVATCLRENIQALQNQGFTTREHLDELDLVSIGLQGLSHTPRRKSRGSIALDKPPQTSAGLVDDKASGRSRSEASSNSPLTDHKSDCSHRRLSDGTSSVSSIEDRDVATDLSAPAKTRILEDDLAAHNWFSSGHTSANTYHSTPGASPTSSLPPSSTSATLPYSQLNPLTSAEMFTEIFSNDTKRDTEMNLYATQPLSFNEFVSNHFADIMASLSETARENVLSSSISLNGALQYDYTPPVRYTDVPLEGYGTTADLRAFPLSSFDTASSHWALGY